MLLDIHILFMLALTAFGSYAVGSIPSAVIVSKLLGLPDPRSYGSGNPGATNVLRSGSKKAAIFTLLGDTLKGVVAVWGVRYVGGDPALAMLFAVLGHVYSCFLAFKGGKGVATAIGVLLAYSPLLALCTLIVFALVLAAFRFVSLASSIAAVSAPLLLWGLQKYGLVLLPITHGVAWWFAPLSLILMSLTIVLRHRQNLHRIGQGTEPKLGQKKTVS